MKEERRQSPRVRIETEVRVESGARIDRFTSFNLSSGGIFLESERPLPVGAQVVLKFELPDAGLVLAEGEVRHHTPVSAADRGDVKRPVRGMGIAFLRVEGAGALALAEQVKKLTLMG